MSIKASKSPCDDHTLVALDLPTRTHLCIQQLAPQLRQAAPRLPALLSVHSQRLLAVHLIILRLGGGPFPLRTLVG